MSEIFREYYDKLLRQLSIDFNCTPADLCEQSLWIIPKQFFPIFTLTAMTERKYPYD